MSRIAKTVIETQEQIERQSTAVRMADSPATRNRFVDFSKGTLILLVTWGHVIQYVQYHNDGFYGDPVFKAIYSFHMPLFMALSGFVSFRSIQRMSFSTIALTRLANLILPILSWTLLLDVGSAMAQHGTSPAAVASQVVADFLGSLWFLWSLYWSILAVAFLRLVRLDNAIGLLVLVALSMVLPEPSYIPLFKFVFPFFCIGYEAGRRKEWLTRLSAGRVAVAGMIAAAIWFFCWLHYSKYTFVYLSGMELRRLNLRNIVLRDVAAVTGSFTFLWAMSFLVKLPGASLFTRMGRGSLYVYILQIYAIALMMGHAFPGWMRSAPAAFGIALALSFVLLLIGETAEKIPGIRLLFFGRLTSRSAPPLAASLPQNG